MLPKFVSEVVAMYHELRKRGTKKHVPFVLTQTFVIGTDSYCGTAGLPLPNGERVGVRGDRYRQVVWTG
jgi:hypothetical protein